MGETKARGRLVCQVDAFTDRIFSGNPAGVVPEAEGLGEAAMLAIARELNNSETAFVFRDGSPPATSSPSAPASGGPRSCSRPARGSCRSISSREDRTSASS